MGKNTFLGRVRQSFSNALGGNILQKAKNARPLSAKIAGQEVLFRKSTFAIILTRNFVKDPEPKPEKLFNAESTALLMEFDRYYFRIRFNLPAENFARVQRKIDFSHQTPFKIGVAYGRNCFNIESRYCKWDVVATRQLTNNDRVLRLSELGHFDLDSDILVLYFDQVGQNNVDWLTIFRLESGNINLHTILEARFQEKTIQ